MNRYFLFILWLSMVIYYGANVYYNNKYSNEGLAIAGIQEEIADLEAENALLKAKILEESSLATINRKARDLGFVDFDYKNYIYLK